MTADFVHPIELSYHAAQIHARIEAITEIRTRLLTRKIALARPRTFIGKWRTPRRMTVDDLIDAIPFGDGAFRAALVFMDDRLLIAVPYDDFDLEEEKKDKNEHMNSNGHRDLKWYRFVGTTHGYVTHYLTDGVHSDPQVVRARVLQACWHLEQLLPNLHELKTTKADAWNGPLMAPILPRSLESTRMH